MLKIMGILAITMLILSCGEAPKENKVRKAVEDVVTRDFKLYEGAKQSLDGIEKTSQQRRENIEELLK